MKTTRGLEFPIPFLCEEYDQNASAFYIKAFDFMIASGIDVSDMGNSRVLLKAAGFSQNGRHSLTRLTSEEVYCICSYCPSNVELWPFFITELQRLMSKMEQMHKQEILSSSAAFVGRPYVTDELAKTIGKLSVFRMLGSEGIKSLRQPIIRELLTNYQIHFHCEDLWEYRKPSAYVIRGEIALNAVLRFLEIYREELIQPPRMKTKNNLDDYQLHVMAEGNYSWLEDGGKSFLELVRDMPLETQYDETPHFSSVVDWFVARRPVMDKNQIKLGWLSLEDKSAQWHARNNNFDYDFYEDHLSKFPDWDCVLERHCSDWESINVDTCTFKIVPLTTPLQLWDESNEMDSCVVSYIEDCLEGSARIFSIRNANGSRKATAELSLNNGRWELVQLKGKYNQELLVRMNYSHNPLTELLVKLVDWYNVNSIFISG